jgi:hypothetical protein
LTQKTTHFLTSKTMADVRPHVLRITVLAACLLTVFLFFDPVGFASSAPGLVHRVAGTNGNTNGVTHIVLFQFKSDVDSDTINKVSLLNPLFLEGFMAPWRHQLTGGGFFSVIRFAPRCWP